MTVGAPHLDSDPTGVVPFATASSGGLPISFGDCAGFLHPGRTRRGVLMAASLGYEAHCVSETWRALAGAIAEAGPSVLRFDYPGTFDSLGDHRSPELVAAWTRSLVEAARVLRAAGDVDELVVVSFGFGAALALKALPEIPHVTALALLAPVLSGREQARELAIVAKIADEYLGVPQDAAEGDLSVAGFRFSAETLAALKSVKTPSARLEGVRRVLVCDRPGRSSAEPLSALLETGAALETRVFEAYATLTFDPTAARPPRDLLTAVAAFAAEGLGPAEARPFTRAPYATLEAAGFVEEGIRFGRGARLFGVLTEPRHGRADRVAILLNTGRSRHSGWARGAVEQARELTAAGLATFRIDVRGIGDSLPEDDAEVLYDDRTVSDVAAALDLLESRGYASAILAGGCSGAFLAFAAGAADPRVDGLVLVNPQRLVWHPGEILAEIMKEGTRTVRGQAAQSRSLRQWRRLLTGEIKLGRVVRAVGRQVGALALGALVRRGVPVSTLAGVRAEIVRRLRTLNARNVPIAFVYGEEDRGREVLAFHFGGTLFGLSPFGNATVEVVPATDHNMTPVAARAVVTAAILRVAGKSFADSVNPPAVNPAEAARVVAGDSAAA